MNIFGHSRYIYASAVSDPKSLSSFVVQTSRTKKMKGIPSPLPQLLSSKKCPLSPVEAQFSPSFIIIIIVVIIIIII